MADNDNDRSDEHALRILEAAYDVEPDTRDALSEASRARMRAAIDRAFDVAWARVRAQAAAEAATPAKPGRQFADWARERILARLAELQRLFGGDLQLAHRKLVTLSDDELRILLADVEDAAARHADETR